jgi:YebC/PmpR family DNA-binding regulatory protein
MWRWPTVQAQKDKNAKAKAKINTLHAKIIAISAEKWIEPWLNSSLADAITNAKRDWVTADVIERAIKRGAWLDKDASKVEEIFYEGYAPGGVAIIVRALSDNRNRTAPNIRHIFSAFGGNLGESGTVSNFAFDYQWMLSVRDISDDMLFEEELLETNAEDYEKSGTGYDIFTSRAELFSTKKALEEKWYTIEYSGFEYIPKNSLHITDFDSALKLYKMLEAFDEDEDIEKVWNNADINETLWNEVEEFVESKKFRT